LGSNWQIITAIIISGQNLISSYKFLQIIGFNASATDFIQILWTRSHIQQLGPSPSQSKILSEISCLAGPRVKKPGKAGRGLFDSMGSPTTDFFQHFWAGSGRYCSWSFYLHFKSKYGLKLHSCIRAGKPENLEFSTGFHVFWLYW
jgi:hypothetical protein